MPEILHFLLQHTHSQPLLQSMTSMEQHQTEVPYEFLQYQYWFLFMNPMFALNTTDITLICR